MPPHRILKTIDFFQKKQAISDDFIGTLWKDFGKSVRESRKKKGVGLKEFSNMIGVSRSMVGFLESGKRQWNFEMARKAVKLLNK
jgi:ribosome-binding protein aMBF1 (putative translation factor)